MASQQVASPSQQSPVQGTETESEGAQDFGSNAVAGDALASQGSAGTPEDPAEREKKLALVRVKLDELKDFQAEGVRRFERDSLIQDPPPYLEGDVEALIKAGLEIGFTVALAPLEVEGAPLAAKLVEGLVGAAKDFAKDYAPTLAVPASGTIDPDALENLVDAWSQGVILGWGNTKGAFELYQSGVAATDLDALLDYLDSRLGLALQAMYSACLGKWVDYCGKAAGEKSGEGFAPDYLVKIDVDTSSAAPPYFASLRELPAVGEKLPQEMLPFSLSDLQVRAELSSAVGLDLVLDGEGSTAEQRSNLQGQQFLACIGSGDYDAWQPGTVPGPFDPASVAAGAEILSAAVRSRTLAELQAGGGWN